MKLIYTQPAHSSNCICIKFDPSGQYFATGSADALMSLWDIDDLTCLRTFSRLVDHYQPGITKFNSHKIDKTRKVIAGGRTPKGVSMLIFCSKTKFGRNQC